MSPHEHEPTIQELEKMLREQAMRQQPQREARPANIFGNLEATLPGAGAEANVPSQTGFRLRVDQTASPAPHAGGEPKVRIITHEKPKHGSLKTKLWSATKNTLKKHKKAAVVAPLAAAVLMYSVQSGMIAEAGEAIGDAKETIVPANDLKEYYAIPKPDCILETAFTAKVRGTANLLVQLSVIDSADPEQAQAVTEARVKAYADKAFVPPEELVTTGIFDSSMYVMSLPEKLPIIPPDSVDKSEEPAAAPQIKNINRIPQAAYIGYETPFSLCLEEGSSMDQEVVEQRSPRNLIVHLDKFSIVFNGKDKAVNDYETNPPQLPFYLESVPAEERQSLFPQSEIDRVYKFLSPEGTYDPATNTYNSGTSRNPAIQEAMRFLVLKEISKGENGLAMQKDAERALTEAFKEAIAPQLETVNKENASNLTIDDIVINFEGAATDPAEIFAATLTTTDETENGFKLDDPKVTYESNSLEKKATS